jgi:hypothetical protein
MFGHLKNSLSDFAFSSSEAGGLTDASPVRRASGGRARFKAGLASVADSHERILLLDHHSGLAEAQLTLEHL